MECGTQNPRPFPSSHPSGSLGSSPSLQPLLHQTRATFTSRFPHLPASVFRLPALLSFRSPESGTTAFGPASARKKNQTHTSASGPCPWGPCPVGLALASWLHPETWRRRRRRPGAGGGGSWGPWRWPGVSRGQLAEARGGSGGALSAGSPSSLTSRLCLFLSSGAGAGRPSVLLLPVRRESVAADTRREYVRARLCRDYRRGTLHSFRQVFALA